MPVSAPALWCSARGHPHIPSGRAPRTPGSARSAGTGALPPGAHTRRARIALVGVGVRAVFDEYRRGKQVVCLAEHVGEITCIGLGHGGCLVAMDDDARRVAAALVRITQLDPSPAHQWRLVHTEGVLERAGELT